VPAGWQSGVHSLCLGPVALGPEVLRVTRCAQCETIFTNPRPAGHAVDQQTATADLSYSKLFVEDLERPPYHTVSIGAGWVPPRNLNYVVAL